MRISDWSSDVCSSDLGTALRTCVLHSSTGRLLPRLLPRRRRLLRSHRQQLSVLPHLEQPRRLDQVAELAIAVVARVERALVARSEEHTSELQSLMRISYAVFCLKKKTKLSKTRTTTQ